MKRAAVALSVLAIACAPTASPESSAPTGQCSVDPVQSLVGSAFSDALATDARRRSGARAVRVVRPGQAVTMDYRADRLNISLDARGKVESLRCG